MAKSYKLEPEKGWSKYSDHESLVDFLHGVYNDRCQHLGWKHMNFTSDTTIFEDPNGSYICLIFSDPDLPLLSELNVDEKSESIDSVINVKNVVDQLVKNFNLKKTPT